MSDILKVCSVLDSLGEFELSDRLAQVNQDYNSRSLYNPGTVGAWNEDQGNGVSNFFNKFNNPMELLYRSYSIAHQMRDWLYHLNIIGDPDGNLKNILVSNANAIMNEIKKQEKTSQYRPQRIRGKHFDTQDISHETNPFMLNPGTEIPGVPISVPSLSLMYRVFASNPYCVRCASSAITIILLRLLRSGNFTSCSSGKNF
jgi:hypothetical protein